MTLNPLEAMLIFSQGVGRRWQIEHLVTMDAEVITVQAMLKACLQMIHVKTCHGMVCMMGLSQMFAQEVRCTNLAAQEALATQKISHVRQCPELCKYATTQNLANAKT